MSERLYLNHLHNRRAGIDLASGKIPAATAFLRPDRLFTGRVVETSGGGCEIPHSPNRRGPNHDANLGAAGGI
jgi:hypothetical protein